MWFKLYLMIIILILVVLIINEITNRIFDNHVIERDWEIVKNKYPGVKIIGVGISKSIVSFTSVHSNVLSHTDIICLSDTGDYYNITECYDDSRSIDYKKKWIEVHKVKPSIKNKFKLRGFDYRIFEMVPVSEIVDLDTIYRLVVDESKLPYHFLKNNCHHSVQRIIDVLTDRNVSGKYSKIYHPKYFEFYKSSYRPLIYIKEFVSDLVM